MWEPPSKMWEHPGRMWEPPGRMREETVNGVSGAEEAHYLRIASSENAIEHL